MPAEAALAGLSALVVDLSELSAAEADARLAGLTRGKVPVLALFALGHGEVFRVRRDALIAAGAADVILRDDSADDLVIRVQALCRINDRPRILVIDDEADIRTWVARELNAIGMEVIAQGTLAEGRAAFRAGPVDALIVDRQLPDGDGLDFVAGLRAARIATPAILYTAMTDVADRVRGLEEAGADDYLCKPAHADELRARVRLVLRPRQTEDQLVFGPLELARRDRIVRWRADRVEMRPRETEMLIYLAERNGLPIPQKMLYLDIWEKVYMEPGSNPVSATKFRLVNALRKFAEARGETLPEFIETTGNCYTFRPEPLLGHDGAGASDTE
ncbi:MAG: response regulator transcription factor [Rhodovulum sp.]